MTTVCLLYHPPPRCRHGHCYDAMHHRAKIFAFATHGLFNGPAPDRIEKSALDEVVITNTVRPTLPCLVPCAVCLVPCALCLLHVWRHRWRVANLTRTTPSLWGPVCHTCIRYAGCGVVSIPWCHYYEHVRKHMTPPLNLRAVLCTPAPCLVCSTLLACVRRASWHRNRFVEWRRRHDPVSFAAPTFPRGVGLL